MSNKPTGPQAVAQAGQLLYGDEWQSPLSRDLKGVHLRTTQRIAKAASEGVDYPVAPGVLKDLAAILERRAASCAAMAAELGSPSGGSRIDTVPTEASTLQGGKSEPGVVALTPAALDAGRDVLEEMGLPRPGRAARAAFLAMARSLGLEVVTPS